VVRSVRLGGDTKTRRSRRRLAIPLRCVDALRRHRKGMTIDPAGLVFATAKGTGVDSHNASAPPSPAQPSPAQPAERHSRRWNAFIGMPER
jgi:hypothetical protein